MSKKIISLRAELCALYDSVVSYKVFMNLNLRKTCVSKNLGSLGGVVVKPKQAPAKLAFEPKGGETTPAKKKAIAKLLSSKDLTGKPLFSKDEMKAYSDMRKDKTASELIDIIIEDRRKRLCIVQPEEVGIPQPQGLDIF